jgi:isopentenyl phosphate kinase
LFTIDEETGMTGALNLKGILQGQILLTWIPKKMKIDMGCAGGIDVTAGMMKKLRRICRIYDYCKRLEWTFGMDIHKGWVMPIKL